MKHRKLNMFQATLSQQNTLPMWSWWCSGRQLQEDVTNTSIRSSDNYGQLVLNYFDYHVWINAQDCQDHELRSNDLNVDPVPEWV